MVIEINTKVSSGPTYGKKLGNLLLEDAKFFGRPNFSGLEDQFKDDRKKFTVLIPNELAEQLRQAGWNVKTSLPQTEEQQELSHLKVMVDNGSDIYIKAGPDADPTKLGVDQFAVMDRSFVDYQDMEIRAWEYDPDERPGQFSARLVSLVATLRMGMLDQKYGML